MYAELIYETGAKSVACYESEEELLGAVKAQHDRALSGEKGGPSSHPAERVVRVEVYDHHPADLGEDKTVSTEVAKEELNAALKELSEGGVVNTDELAARIRDLASPLVASETPHDSMFKAEAVMVLTPEMWEGGDE